MCGGGGQASFLTTAVRELSAAQHRLCPLASSLFRLQGSQSLGWAKCGHNLEEKLGVARGHMHLRSRIQSAMGYYIRILWSCVITCHPRCSYPVCATQGEWHGLAPTPCSLPGVSACLFLSPLFSSSSLYPRAPFSIDTGVAPLYRVVFPASSIFISPQYLLYVKHWRGRQKPRRHGFCTKCKYVGVMYKYAHTCPSHTGTANHEECCRGSMNGQGYTRKRSIVSAGGKLRGNLGRLPGGGDV